LEPTYRRLKNGVRQEESMEKDILLLVAGGGLGLFSSITTLIINHVLASRRQKQIWDHETEVLKLKRIAEEEDRILSSTLSDDKRKIIRDKLQQGGKIIVPETKYACFITESNVNMKDGTVKRIIDVEVGDEVLSFDMRSNSYSSTIVSEIKNKKSSEFMIINDQLKLTRTHKVFVNDNIKPAGNIFVGEQLFSLNNERIEVNRIELIKMDVDVVNLIVKNGLPFFVEGFMVGDYLSKQQPDFA